jgi:tRNA(Ile)-lysidine synthase
MGFLEKIQKWIRGKELIRCGDSITAAVSGGADSMAMLAVLNKLAADMELTISAAHFNHRIRREAGSETALVAEYCEEYGIPFITGSADVPAEAEKRSKGLEETARELRYSFLEEAAAKLNADAVSLGHNLNDQAETVLHHLIRGSGFAGLAGIPPRRGRFIRPLLCCSRDEIEAFVSGESIPFAVDSSNRDTRYLRNRIRHHLLPELAENYNSSIVDSLGRLAGNVSELTGPVKERIEPILESKMEDDSVIFPIEKIGRLDDFQIYMFTSAALKKYFGVHQDIHKCHFDAVKSLVKESPSGRKVVLPHGIEIFREQLQLRFSRQEAEKAPRPKPVEIRSEGRYRLPGFGSRAVIEKISPSQAGPFISTADRALLGGIRFPLTVRTRREGDRVIPFGMNGSRKISDLMIDRKVPLGRRDRIPVIEDADGIVWVPGLVTAERTRIAGDEEQITRIRLEK